MKAIKQQILFLLFLIATTIVQAQEPKEIKIGDQLPKMSFDFMDKKNVAHTELLKKKLLIIDFWATWCVPCLAEIEFLDSLKKQHPDALEIVMVTSEDSTLINKFFKKHPNYKSPRINYVTNDTNLRKLFPHRGLPHNVWIDDKGTVKAITDTREVNVKNILGFNAGTAGTMYTKKDVLNFDLRNRLDVLNENFTYRSIFGPRAEGISGQDLGFGPLSKTAYRFATINSPLSHLLYRAYKFGSFKDQLLEIVTKDSLKFFSPEGKKNQHLLMNSKYKDLREWELANSVCYDLFLPKKVAVPQLQAYVYQDLERLFNLKITEVMAPRTVIEVKQRPRVYALEPSSTDNPWVSFMPGNKLKIKNATPAEVFEWFFTLHSVRVAPLPYLVEIKDKGVINAEIDFSSFLKESNQEGVSQAIFEKGMATLGFTFQKKTRDYKILRVIDLDDQ